MKKNTVNGNKYWKSQEDLSVRKSMTSYTHDIVLCLSFSSAGKRNHFLFRSFVVSEILSGENRETIVETIHTKLQEVGQKVKDGEIPVELYQITKVRSEKFYVIICTTYLAEVTVREQFYGV